VPDEQVAMSSMMVPRMYFSMCCLSSKDPKEKFILLRILRTFCNQPIYEFVVYNVDNAVISRWSLQQMRHFWCDPAEHIQEADHIQLIKLFELEMQKNKWIYDESLGIPRDTKYPGDLDSKHQNKNFKKKDLDWTALRGAKSTIQDVIDDTEEAAIINGGRRSTRLLKAKDNISTAAVLLPADKPRQETPKKKAAAGKKKTQRRGGGGGKGSGGKKKEEVPAILVTTRKKSNRNSTTSYTNYEESDDDEEEDDDGFRPGDGDGLMHYAEEQQKKRIKGGGPTTATADEQQQHHHLHHHPSPAVPTIVSAYDKAILDAGTRLKEKQLQELSEREKKIDEDIQYTRLKKLTAQQQHEKELAEIEAEKHERERQIKKNAVDNHLKLIQQQADNDARQERERLQQLEDDNRNYNRHRQALNNTAAYNQMLYDRAEAKRRNDLEEAANMEDRQTSNKRFNRRAGEIALNNEHYRDIERKQMDLIHINSSSGMRNGQQVRRVNYHDNDDWKMAPSSSSSSSTKSKKRSRNDAEDDAADETNKRLRNLFQSRKPPRESDDGDDDDGEEDEED